MIQVVLHTRLGWARVKSSIIGDRFVLVDIDHSQDHARNVNAHKRFDASTTSVS